MKKYFDKNNGRIVCVGEPSTANYWDKTWNTPALESILKHTSNPFITSYTKKYLKSGARILEGGCGRGDKVHSLQCSGYDAYGIDYAPEIIRKIHALVPELKVQVGDIRGLPFENNFFDGYWSLGVIEHFYDGYDVILNEMFRVLKPGGFVFLTFPSMSPLRKLKAHFDSYPAWENDKKLEEIFYQFILTPSRVEADFIDHGFHLLETRGADGIKGLKDEINPLRKSLQRLYDSRTFSARLIKRALDLPLRTFAGHTQFCVFRKQA